VPVSRSAPHVPVNIPEPSLITGGGQGFADTGITRSMIPITANNSTYTVLFMDETPILTTIIPFSDQ
jgi:hypothetical protein